MSSDFSKIQSKNASEIEQLLFDAQKSDLSKIYQVVKRLAEIPTEESARAVITLAREVLIRYESEMKPYTSRIAQSMLKTGMELHSRPGPPPTINQFMTESKKQFPSALSGLGKPPDKPDFQPFATSLLQIGEQAVPPVAELCEGHSVELKEMGKNVLKGMDPEQIIRALPRLRTSASFREWLARGIQAKDPEQAIHLQIAKGDWISVKASASKFSEEMWEVYLHHHDPIVHAKILELLIAEKHPLAQQACREALLSERAEVKTIAIQHAPDLLGAECRGILASFLSSGDQNVRLLAAESLSHYGTEVAEIFKQAFASNDWKERQAAVHVLAKWGGINYNQLLEQARNDPTPLVRREAYRVP